MGCVVCRKHLISTNTLSSRNKTTNSLTNKDNIKAFFKDEHIFETIREGIYFTIYKTLTNGKFLNVTIYENEKGKVKPSEFDKIQNLNRNLIQSVKILERQIQVTSEHVSDESLLDKITKCSDLLSENEIKAIMKQLFTELSYIHNEGIIIRDICPENIIINNKKEIKFINAGIVSVIDSIGLSNGRLITNPFYIAPELLSSKYIDKSDVWSCGVIMYVLLTGTYPFQANRYIDYITGVSWINFDDECFKDIGQQALDLLKSILKYNAEDRPNAKDVVSHEWFSCNIVSDDSDLTVKRQNVADLINHSYSESRLLLSISSYIQKFAYTKKTILLLRKYLSELTKRKINVSELSQLMESFLSEIDVKTCIDKYLEKNEESKLNMQNFVEYLEHYKYSNTYLLEKAFKYYVKVNKLNKILNINLKQLFEIGIIYDNVVLKEGFFHHLGTELDKSELDEYSFDDIMGLVYLTCDYFDKI
jgi:calcium-dependent protein kinase